MIPAPTLAGYGTAVHADICPRCRWPYHPSSHMEDEDCDGQDVACALAALDREPRPDLGEGEG